MEFSAPPANEFHTAEGIDALKQQLGDIREATQPAADRIYQEVRWIIVDQATGIRWRHERL
jgi:hypothetical protein